MMEVIIKFFGLGYNSNYQASVVIYDDKNNIVYDGNTYNGKLKLYLKKKHIYKVIAKFMGDIINTNIYINTNNKLCFKFRNSTLEDNPITFLLTDYYYDNLPIERGEIILWQR